MTYDNIQNMFNRAVAHTFILKKLLFSFVVIALCGLLVVFFQGFAALADPWLTLSLTFFPIFICAGVIMAYGVMIIRIYHDEIKNRPLSYRNILGKSWDVVVGASYLSIPVALVYLLVWMLMGIFFLLREVPGVGEFFATMLIFTPFLLNLATVALCVLSVVMLFVLTPILSFKGFNRMLISQTLSKRFRQDVFSNVLLFIVVLIPLALTIGILSLTMLMTQSMYWASPSPLTHVIQTFFLMIPYAALLTPALVFFFNFAAESHLYMQKMLNKDAENPA